VDRLPNSRGDLGSNTLTASAETWWSTLTEYQREVGRFISDRLSKDGEAIRETLTSRTWSDVLDVQSRWVDETLRDYDAEMSKLTQLYAKGAGAPAREDRHRS
jgi:hypothetical protein